MKQNLSIQPAQDQIRALFRSIAKKLSAACCAHRNAQDFISIRCLLRQKSTTPYCALIHSVPGGLQRCGLSDARLAAVFKRTSKPCWHYCHAGLVDFLFPIPSRAGAIPVIGGQLVFRPINKQDEERLLNKVSDLPLNRESLRKALKSIPVISQHSIKEIIALITVMLEELPGKERPNFTAKLPCHEIPKYAKVRQAIAFIDNHYQDDFFIKELAAKIRISPYYLAHLFRSALGFSVMDYRNHLRIASAKEMLKETSRPIKEIAFSLGYNDSNYFSTSFKKVTGFCPLAYRRAFRKRTIL
ncbi:MAG: helix-turn-helix domain-containing protein [Verrucomicrobiota bacterium]